MGVQAQDTSSGKSTTPPQANWAATTNNDGFSVGGGTASSTPSAPPESNPWLQGLGIFGQTPAPATSPAPAPAASPATYTPSNDGFVVGGGRDVGGGTPYQESDYLRGLGYVTDPSTGNFTQNIYAGQSSSSPADWGITATPTGVRRDGPPGGAGVRSDGFSVGGGNAGGSGGGYQSTGGSRYGNSYGGGGFGAPPVQGPVDDASRQRVEEAILSRLEPQFQQDEANLRNKLITSGLEVGSHAYNTELDRLKRSQTDARMQAILAGGTEESRQVGMNSQLQSLGFSQGLQGAQFDNQVRQQMLSELLLQRNTPLNELNSLRTGSQVSMPNFQGYYTNNATPAPIFDAAQSTGNYNMAAWQQQQAGANALLGGLASLGGAGIIRYSDARLKEDIRLIGQTPGGVNLYSWKWKDGSGEDSGVIAQEVVLSHPEAVSTDTSGFLMVDYSKLH